MALFRDSTLSAFSPQPLTPTRAPARLPGAKQKDEDLRLGLESIPKRIPSKYFYDDEGTRLFSRIMDEPEYYLTRCEEEIFQVQGELILSSLGELEQLNIVELGAGDGRKTQHLLRAAQKRIPRLTYRPVDISSEALRGLEATLTQAVPGLSILPTELDLEVGWAELPVQRKESNLILYCGSTIGNMVPHEQRQFLRRLRSRLHPGDYVLIGFDLKKNHRIMQSAYDDTAGVTRTFNLNLLRRFNREFGANFTESNFRHLASYNPHTGAMESWLISQCDQTVDIPKLSVTLRLQAFEGIQLETSWKFTLSEVSSLALLSGFEPLEHFFDHRKWFVDDLWSCTPTGAFF